jgi:hypothetical protein
LSEGFTLSSCRIFSMASKSSTGPLTTIWVPFQKKMSLGREKKRSSNLWLLLQ